MTEGVLWPEVSWQTFPDRGLGVSPLPCCALWTRQEVSSSLDWTLQSIEGPIRSYILDRRTQWLQTTMSDSTFWTLKAMSQENWVCHTQINSQQKNSRNTKLINPVYIRSRPDQFMAESVEDDEDGEADVITIRRYPQRVRCAPAQYDDYVPLSWSNVRHISSSKEGAM